MTQISQLYILPLWISDHLHEKFKNLNIPFLFSKSEFNTWYACVPQYIPFVMSRSPRAVFLSFWDYHDFCSFSNGAVTFFLKLFHLSLKTSHAKYQKDHFLHRMYPTVLKRPPSGRKVWGTTKSVSPRTVQYNNTVLYRKYTLLYSTVPPKKI